MMGIPSPVRAHSGVGAVAPRPRVLFVGGTRYRLPLSPGLARKWAALEQGLDLRVIARAGLVEAADPRFRLREFPTTVRAVERLEPPEVARLLDESTVLAMSSAAGAERLPRVIMEAFARGRPVGAPAVGGITELVVPGRNGLLVEPGDPGQLAEALLRVIGERDPAQRLADGAREDARPYEWSPGGYADSVREMVDRVLADPP
jgi:glycosyltransferase involved in cell wall biosynthesis